MQLPQKRQRLKASVILFCLWLTSANLVLGQQGPYAKEGPLWLDFDMQSIAEPARVETGYLYDFAEGTIFQQTKQAFDLPRHFRHLAGKRQEAYNVNSLDEVPDSSWFTNRNGRRPLSLEEIKRGPNETDGPAAGQLTVVRGKTSGITPGFQIRDQRGDLYLLKFDPPEYPELATAAEVIATKLFHAIGYNVPQNTIFYFTRAQLQLAAQAPYTDETGRKRPMTEADIERLLSRAARLPDGRYRAVASKFLKGKPKGGFTFAGVRRDDPNDIIPHEHRRDLRGLRVFAAWLEHNDIRVGNTLDMYVTDQGRQFLRHYLIDFGSTLGSDTTFPNVPIVGREHQLDGRQAMKRLFTFGLYQGSWLAEQRELAYKSVGYYSADQFQPARWKQNFPLVAFENLTDRDAYWAAKIVGSFTDEQIRAAVETGELSDPAAADYLARQIMARRDKIVSYYIQRRTGLDQFVVERSDNGFTLRFADLRLQALAEPKPATFEYELRSAAEPKLLLERGTLATTALALSGELLTKLGACGRTEADRGVARLTLRRRGENYSTQAYLHYDQARAGLTVVGLQH